MESQNMQEFRALNYVRRCLEEKNDKIMALEFKIQSLENENSTLKGYRKKVIDLQGKLKCLQVKLATTDNPISNVRNHPEEYINSQDHKNTATSLQKWGELQGLPQSDNICDDQNTEDIENVPDVKLESQVTEKRTNAELEDIGISDYSHTTKNYSVGGDSALPLDPATRCVDFDERHAPDGVLSSEEDGKEERTVYVDDAEEQANDGLVCVDFADKQASEASRLLHLREAAPVSCSPLKRPRISVPGPVSNMRVGPSQESSTADAAYQNASHTGYMKDNIAPGGAQGVPTDVLRLDARGEAPAYGNRDFGARFVRSQHGIHMKLLYEGYAYRFGLANVTTANWRCSVNGCRGSASTPVQYYEGCRVTTLGRHSHPPAPHPALSSSDIRAV